jgi:hypothetical protein
MTPEVLHLDQPDVGFVKQTQDIDSRSARHTTQTQSVRAVIVPLERTPPAVELEHDTFDIDVRCHHFRRTL